MNEFTKTLVFVAAALVVGATAWATRPKLDFESAADDTGQLFYPDFQDPAKATSLELVRFDEATGDVEPFKVAKQGGRWVLPSHENYPADAEKKVGEAAASLIDLKKLGIASTLPTDHEKLGVVDPSTAKPGAKGTGLKATVADDGGKALVSMIIGKEVPDDPKQRFVRVPGKEAVYRTTVNPAQLSSKFEDWIEKDLLKLNSWDIARVVLDNYSINLLEGKLVEGDKLDLKYDDKDSKWSLVDLKEGEELNTETLNTLKTALDDLKIVDVRRKPAGLSAELRQEEGAKLDREAVESLASKGFLINQGELLSNEGQSIVRMKDGVTYVLRFGEIAGQSTPAPAEKDGKPGEPSGANRYLFVMAQFDPELIEKPTLEPLPEEPTAAGPAAAEATSTPAEQTTTPAEQPTTPAPETKPAENSAAPANPGVDGDGAAQESAPPAANENPPAPAAVEGATPAPPSEQALERQRIEQENKRKQDEYQKKLEEGAKRAKELNDRFSDWYYVISDDVYKKIHLARKDVIKASNVPPAAQGGAVKQFEDMKTEGIEGGAPAAPAAPGRP